MWAEMNEYGFLVRKPEGQRPLVRLGTDGRVLLKQVLPKMGWEGMDRVYLTQGKDQSEALVYMLMKFYVMWGILCLTEDVLASQEGLWSMEIVGLVDCTRRTDTTGDVK